MSFSFLNGIIVHWHDRGPRQAPAVIFVNSLGTDCRIWDDVIASLGNRYRTIVCDSRGHGLSSATPAPYSIDALTDDLIALVDHLRLESFVLIGISMGGLIAQNFAARAPGRLKGLVLADTAARIGTRESWDARIDAIRKGSLESIADAVMERWFGPDFRKENPTDVAGWRNHLLRIPAEGYIGGCTAVRDADLTKSLVAISVPTLAIAGDQDASTPPDVVRQTAAAIKGARFATIAASGHLPPIEQPEAFSRLLTNFLEGIGHV